MNPKTEFKNRLCGQFNKLPTLTKTRLPRIKTALCVAAALCGPLAGAQAQPNPRSGTVVGWGANVMPYVAPGTRFSALAAGYLHSLALKSDSTVVAWGDNYYGQCIVPVGLSNIIAIAAGEYHSLALKSDGTVVAWGDNYYGQCI